MPCFGVVLPADMTPPASAISQSRHYSHQMRRRSKRLMALARLWKRQLPYAEPVGGSVAMSYQYSCSRETRSSKSADTHSTPRWSAGKYHQWAIGEKIPISLKTHGFVTLWRGALCLDQAAPCCLAPSSLRVSRRSFSSRSWLISSMICINLFGSCSQTACSQSWSHRSLISPRMS